MPKADSATGCAVKRAFADPRATSVDVVTKQDAMNMQSFDRVYEWYTSGPRQRLQPGGRIILVMTRWNVADLTGKLQRAQKEPKTDQWEVIEFPAIMPSGKPLWPEFWSQDELDALKAELPVSKWSAQYQQSLSIARF